MKQEQQHIRGLRQDYDQGFLLESDAPDEPISLFHAWLSLAIEHSKSEPHVVCLATSTPEGRPSQRIVLLRGFDHGGFVFFTNYQSQKGQEIAANPFASMNFFWPELEKQVRIEGKVEKVSEAESDAYFMSRPRESRIGAWASAQSRVLVGREALEEEVARVRAHFERSEVERPEWWGGYRLFPDLIEFWQGRPSRLHDRLVYRKVGDSWNRERLSP